MTVLSKREVWRRPAPLAEVSPAPPDFSDEEVANIQAALRFLRTRLGSVKLAKALHVNKATVARALGTRQRPSATVALRVARAAGVSVDAVLAGAWPKAGACPHCGRD